MLTSTVFRMNYYNARQVDPNSDRPDAGKWRYTLANRRTGTYAVGYCADCPGHDTPEEAREHYRQYMLNERVRRFEMQDQQQRCEVCKEWTQHCVEVDHMQLHVLCTEHDTPEVLAEIVPPVGEIWSSY